MEFIWVIIIVAGAFAAAMLLNVKEHKRTLEELAERAVRFGEDCYVEGIIPIQKVKRLGGVLSAGGSAGKDGAGTGDAAD